MKNGFIQTGIFALVHFVLYWVVTLLAMGGAMSRMDNGGDAGSVETVAGILWSVFAFPLLSLVYEFGLNIPGLLGHVAIVANSMLWGFATCRAIQFARRAKHA